MTIGWDLDFTGQTIESVDKSAGTPPDGYYRSKLHEVVPDDDGRLEFKFKVCHGPQSGRLLRGKLNNPRFADTPEHRDSALQKARVWAIRLGLVPKEAEGRSANVNWTLAVGREVVVKVKTKVYEKKKDGIPTGEKGEWQEIEYAGIYPLDHGDLDGPTRVSLDLPLLPGQSATDPKAGSAKSTKAVPGAASGAPVTSPANTDAAVKALFAGS